MTIELSKTNKHYLINFPSEINIYSVSSLRENLQELMASFGEDTTRIVNLDLRSTEEIDWTGIQLVISFIKTLKQAGFHKIELKASEGVSTHFKFFGIKDHLSIQIG